MKKKKGSTWITVFFKNTINSTKNGSHKILIFIIENKINRTAPVGTCHCSRGFAEAANGVARRKRSPLQHLPHSALNKPADSGVAH